MSIRPKARNGTFCGVCGRPAAGNGPHALCDVCSAGIMEGPGSAATQPGQRSEPDTKEKAACGYYNRRRSVLKGN